MTGENTRRKSEKKGITLKEWASVRSYPFYLVVRVISETIKGHFDLTHKVAVELGMKPESNETLQTQ